MVSRSSALLLLFVSAVCSADVLVRPEPASIACDGEYPQGIEGHWRQDPTPISSSPESEADSLGGMQVETASTQPMLEMIITGDKLVLRLQGLFDLTRSYRLVGGSSNRYVLETYDHLGSGSPMTLTLQPCGLIMEGAAACDEHCERMQDEIFAQIAEKMGLDAQTLKQKSTISAPSDPPMTNFYRLLEKSP